MRSTRMVILSSVIVVWTFVFGLTPDCSSGAGIKEIVVQAGSYNRVYCPIEVTCETPTAVAAVKSLKTADGKIQLPVQSRKTEDGSVMTFIVPKMAANQTLYGEGRASVISFVSNSLPDNRRIKTHNNTVVRDLAVTETGVTGRTGYYGLITSEARSNVIVTNVYVYGIYS